MERRLGAGRRLAAWNDGDTEATAPGYAPDALDWQLDLRFVLAELASIETEAKRVTKGYEALNGIIASMRALEQPRLAFADAAEALLRRWLAGYEGESDLVILNRCDDAVHILAARALLALNTDA